VNIAGLGAANCVNAKANTPNTSAGLVEVQGDVIVAHLNGRTYFGDYCNDDQYNNDMYKAVPLLGKTMTYTIDLSGAGCGCNAALYLVSLKQSTSPSLCGDHYCDANSVCGVRCSEIDIQEANIHAWRSTLHLPEDGKGVGFGYGGVGPYQQAWTGLEYGPGARCIDTNRPFQVAVGFPLNADGTLKGMQIVLSQPDMPCEAAGIIEDYPYGGRNGIAELATALSNGMTPVISYWNSSILWLDGKGSRGGPCARDFPQQCPDSIRIYGFSVNDGVTPAPITTTMTTTMAPVVLTQAPVMAGPGASPATVALPGASPATVARPGVSPGVPPGWKAAIGPSGKVYYYNQVTGASSWAVPQI
jgi:hypothetical protein